MKGVLKTNKLPVMLSIQIALIFQEVDIICTVEITKVWTYDLWNDSLILALSLMFNLSMC